MQFLQIKIKSFLLSETDRTFFSLKIVYKTLILPNKIKSILHLR